MNNSTEVLPYIESGESSLVVPDFDQAPLVVTDQFPGLAKPGMTDDQLEDALITASEYMSDYVNVGDDHLSRTIKGVLHLQILEAWGALVVKKEGMFFVNSKSGEEKQAYGVVFKLRQEDNSNSFSYLGFTSISALNFMYKFVMPLPGIRGQLGDWSRPVRFSVTEVPMKTGHTFSFKLVKGLQP